MRSPTALSKEYFQICFSGKCRVTGYKYSENYHQWLTIANPSLSQGKLGLCVTRNCIPSYLAYYTGATFADSVIHVYSCSPGGIGNSLAREFRRNGLRVFATARDKSSITSLKEQGIETLSLEVDKEESRKACRDEVELLLKGKGLDYLVNNA